MSYLYVRLLSRGRKRAIKHLFLRDDRKICGNVQLCSRDAPYDPSQALRKRREITSPIKRDVGGSTPVDRACHFGTVIARSAVSRRESTTRRVPGTLQRVTPARFCAANEKRFLTGAYTERASDDAMTLDGASPRDLWDLSIRSISPRSYTAKRMHRACLDERLSERRKMRVIDRPIDRETIRRRNVIEQFSADVINFERDASRLIAATKPIYVSLASLDSPVRSLRRNLRSVASSSYFLCIFFFSPTSRQNGA